MPLLYFDLVGGRTPEEVRGLVDSAHAAVVEAFEAPERDRYQVVNVHSAEEIVALDTGLGFERSERLLVIHVVSRAERVPKSNTFIRCSPTTCTGTAASMRPTASSRSPRTPTRTGRSAVDAHSS